jgi:hypothetical protein
MDLSGLIPPMATKFLAISIEIISLDVYNENNVIMVNIVGARETTNERSEKCIKICSFYWMAQSWLNKVLLMRKNLLAG